MKLRRRELIASLGAPALALSAFPARGQEDEAAARGRGRARGPAPKRTVTIEKLFKTESRNPNALETTPDGLWVCDQITEIVYKVDWNTGKTLLSFPTESHNTSGLAVGAGYVWLDANGRNSRREKRSADRPYGEIIQADMKTGKTIKVYRTPWGGCHGITYNSKTGTLWCLALGVMALAELDPKDNLRILKMFPVSGDRPHGLDFDDAGDLWLVVSGDKIVERRDPATGQVKEVITFAPSDPDPHGAAIRNGYLYLCDAGVGSGPSSQGSDPGEIFGFQL
jgi:streptogramin lyase